MSQEKTVKIEKLIKLVQKTQNDIKKCNDILRPKMRSIRKKSYPKTSMQHSIRNLILVYEQWKRDIAKSQKEHLKQLKQYPNQHFWEFQLMEMKELQEEFKEICRNQKKLVRFLV